MEEDNVTIKARELYVLLNKNYRISRNIRLIWFFNNILKDVKTLPKVFFKDGRVEDSDGSEIQVLSWAAYRGSELYATSKEEWKESRRNDIQEHQAKPETMCTIQPETDVYFLSRGYRLVFALDLSPSLFQVCTQSHQTTAEELLSRLAECLCGLVEAFQVPYSDIDILPSIYVTVFTQVRQSHRAEGRYKQDIIVQGCLLTPCSIVTILKSVECKIYHEQKAWNEPRSLYSLQPSRHDHGLVSMLRTSLLALQLLPSNTSAGILVITDGVVGIPDMAVLETLINQLRSSTTSCSVLQLKTPESVFCNYAFCPSIELLRFISSATCGAFFDSDGSFETSQGENMNVYQKGLLIWQFQLNEEKRGVGLPEMLDVRNWEPEADLRYTPKQKNMYIAPVLRKKHFERTLRVSLFAVLSVRLREGYMITSMSLGKSGNQLEVKLVYPWNHSASIKYVATSAWPVLKNQTKVEVFIEGTYEFLFDVTSGVRQENSSRQRVIVFRRFTHFMKGLSQTDHMLTHLLSFTSDPVHYRVGQKQVPLFYLPPNSNQLVLSNEKDSSKPMFAMYWKPILSLDASIWQKWMHTHHIDIILQHDIPLPKHLHIPTKSGRFHSIQTSTAMSQLASLLREWCTFVLLENHSYIKFTYKESEDRPTSFYVVRLSNKAPVVVIRLAFLIGSPGSYRNQVLSELRDRVLSLTFPSVSKQLPGVNLRNPGIRSRHSSAQSHSRYLSGTEQRPCVTLYHKPLDRILIRYDQAPRDFLRPPVSSHRRSKSTLSTLSSKSESQLGGEVSSTSMMLDPCRYLQHHRSVWSITNRSLTPLVPAVAGQMASLLVKLRLSEGFNFASTSSGVITMVREFTMMTDEFEGSSDNTHKCLCQFVLFTSTTCTSRERKFSFSPDGSGEEDEDGTEADGELFLSAETWTEPQCGVVSRDGIVRGSESGQDSRPPSRLGESGRNSRFSSVSSATAYAFSPSLPYQRFLGSTYKGIARIISDEDTVLLSVLVTIEHFRLMCVPKSLVLDTLPQKVQKSNAEETLNHRLRKRSTQTDTEGRSTPGEKKMSSYEEISHASCLFDLVALLDRCPRMKLLFMTLTQGCCGDENLPSANDCLFELFQQSLERISDREALLSSEDCIKITEHMIRRESASDVRDYKVCKENPKSKWKCFLKVLPKAKVMVILLPASYQDLKEVACVIPGLVNVRPSQGESAETAQDSIPEKFSPRAEVTRSSSEILEETIQEFVEKPSLSRDDSRLSRRKSIKRIGCMVSSKSTEEKESQDSLGFETQENQASDSLPVFVYECSTSSLVDSLVKDPSLVPQQWSDLDMEYDYRITSVDSKTELELKPIFFRSLSYPFHYNQRSGNYPDEFLSPPAEDVFATTNSTPQQKIDSETVSLYDSIVNVYHRCFVRAVSNNLRKNDGCNVARQDVQAATDAICLESVQEIDITQFLLITSPQVAAFRNQHLSREVLDQRDNDDVFSLAPHFPIRRVEPKIRHTSSTSSNADLSSKQRTLEKPSASESSEQSTGGSKHRVSRINVKNVEEDGSTVAITDEKQETPSSINEKAAGKQAGRSAFKKLRRRPQSLPKSGNLNAKERSDTDGDSPESEISAFLPMHTAESNAASQRDTPVTDATSMPRSLMVEKPIVKLPVTSKVGWDDLPEFPVGLLKENHPRHISGNDDQVRMNFRDLLSQNFRPIQTMPDIFYHKLEELAPDVSLHTNRNPLLGVRDRENTMLESETVNGAGVESDQDVKFELSESELPAPNHGPHDDYETLSSDMEKMVGLVKKKVSRRRRRRLSDLEDFDEDFATLLRTSSTSESFSDDAIDSESEKDVPLFLCMTCTVRDKKTGNHGTMLAKGLPTSLQSVLENLENECDTIDLSQLSITLDLIWMVLPREEKKSDYPSLLETRFSSGLLPEEEDSPRHESAGSNERIQTLHDDQEPVDPLIALPPATWNVVNSTKEEIEWLLEDEIISALRTCDAIDVSTLEKVARHIGESRMENCMVETTNLQFVFGAEKSLQLFNALFEKMFKDFKGYRMKKVDDYYYFTTERIFLPIQHWPEDHFTGDNENYQLDRTNTTSDLDPNLHMLHAINASSSSSGKQLRESKKDEILQHFALSRTKTAPDRLYSAPCHLTVSTRSCTSLFQPAPFMPSSLSFHSLPDNEVMSVDAIESDVGGVMEISTTKLASSSQSTPIRKTSSALDVVSPAVSSPGCSEGLSPNIQAKMSKSSGRGAHSRLSLPNAITHNVCGVAGEKSSKKKRPFKQKSFESNLNISGKVSLKRHNANAVTPLSQRNSPLQCSEPTSPHLINSKCHNSSSGSVGSAPTCRRRSMNSTTSISQLVQREVASISSEPGSSAPLMKIADAGGNEQGQPLSAAFANSAYLFGGGNKDAAASPVSLSDSEFRRLSTASWLESGYDGEESDLEAEEGYVHSLDGANDLLPSFWLIVHVLNDIIKMYFHRRNSVMVSETIMAEQKRVFNAVKEYVNVTCKRVNQTLLLLELHDSRMCNALLVEKTEEDIWKQDYTYANFGIADDHGDDTDRALLAASMTNAPGQFACDCLLEANVSLHPRLRTSGNVSGKSSVIATVKDLVINLMVTNRKNMFVYQLADKSVFYCRMEEDIGGPPSGKPDSRRSSQLYQTPTPSLEVSGIDASDRRTSRESLIGLGQLDASKSGGTLSLRWHGVGPLSPHQEQELKTMNESITKRLNDSVLEKITVILQRNSKLSSSDVQFIQPTVPPPTTSSSPVVSRFRHVSPNDTLSYGLPDEFCGCLSAVKYYLHQNLLQFMAIPRYIDTTTQSSGQFVAYRMKGSPASDSMLKATLFQPSEGSVFLFHQSIEPGKTGYGIACVILEITDAEGNQIPADSNLKFAISEELNVEQLINLTEVIDDQEVVSSISNSRSYDTKLFIQSLLLRNGSIGSGQICLPPVGLRRSNTPALSEQYPSAAPRKSSCPVKNYVRFHLWRKGSLTLGHLNNRLRPAIRHSLFDVITELLILRAPLGDHEKQDADIICPMETQKSKRLQYRLSRKLSLPSASFAIQKKSSDDDRTAILSSTCPGKTKSHTHLSRVRSSPSDSTSGKTDTMRSLFESLNDPNSTIGRGILTNLLHPKLVFSAREESNVKQSGGGKKSAVTGRRKSAGARKAEEWDVGNLHGVYKDSSKDWFDAMKKNGCPSVFKVNLNLSNMSHLENMLQDVKQIFNDTLTECEVRIFSCHPGKSGAYKFTHDAPAVEKRFPARYSTYIVAARNCQLWRRATGTFPPDLITHLIAATAKFSPYDSSVKPEQSPRTQEHCFTTSSVGYIPRQQFVIVHIQSRKVNVRGYNVANEIATNFQTKLLNCTNFHNARWRALNCLTFQKLSLFRHCTFEAGFATLKSDKIGTNPFTRDVKDVDVVVTNTKVPSENEIQSQRRTKSNRRAFFNEAFVSNIPVRRLSVSKYGNEKDVSTQFAKQYLEMKGNLKKRNEEQQHLHRVFSNWCERPSSASITALTKDVLRVLLRHTRVIHHVTSPILFSSYIRKQMRGIKAVDSDSDALSTKDVQLTKKQKRMSGSIRRSGDFSGKLLDDGKSRSRSNSTRKEGTKDKGSKSNLRQMVCESLEESRYDLEELQKALMWQYVQYWQSMHFILVKEDKRSKHEKMMKKSQSTERDRSRHEGSQSQFENSLSNVDSAGNVNQPLYLYRVSADGIIVVEVCFVGMNFSVKLHIIEATRLQHQLNLKQQMNVVLFLNECEHLKDLTHVHSFMYDFHLRYIQMYIQERQTAIKQGYHLVSLLRDFTKYHRVLPRCAFNQIYHGVVEAPCSHVTADELYEYLVGRQASQLKFRTLKLVGDAEKTEHALVSSHLIIDKTHSPSCNEEEHDVYDIGYVIWHNVNKQKAAEKKIQLDYFLLFTNRRHLFPRLERREHRLQAVFPIRRGSANVAPKSSGMEKKTSDKIVSPPPLPGPSVFVKQQDMSPTSQSTSSLQRLTSENSPSENENHTRSVHLSPVTTRKLKGESISSLKSPIAGPNSPFSPPSSKPEDAFASAAPPSFIKKRFFAQGRRQSMPNVGGLKQGQPASDTVQTQSPIVNDRTLKQPVAVLSEPGDLPSFVQCETIRLRNYLINVCALAEIQCYRNQLWNRVYTDKPSQNKASSLPIEDFEHLLKHCQMIPLSKLDSRGNALCDATTMGLPWAMNLQKHILAKFDKICRSFVNNEGSKIYLGVLNPKLYPMMFLITVDTEKKKIGMFVVMRDKLSELDKDEPDLSNGNATLIPLMGHLNDMVGFICFHTWSALVSS